MNQLSSSQVHSLKRNLKSMCWQTGYCLSCVWSVLWRMSLFAVRFIYQQASQMALVLWTQAERAVQGAAKGLAMQLAAGSQQCSSLCLRRGFKRTDPEPEDQPQRLGAKEYRNRCLLVCHAFLALKIPRMVGLRGNLLFCLFLRKSLIPALVCSSPDGGSVAPPQHTGSAHM